MSDHTDAVNYAYRHTDLVAFGHADTDVESYADTDAEHPSAAGEDTHSFAIAHSGSDNPNSEYHADTYFTDHAHTEPIGGDTDTNTERDPHAPLYYFTDTPYHPHSHRH